MKNNKLAPIYNGAWWIRHYSRPAKRSERAAAVARLGLAARALFNESEDFEPVLRALTDALAGAWPRD